MDEFLPMMPQPFKNGTYKELGGMWYDQCCGSSGLKRRRELRSFIACLQYSPLENDVYCVWVYFYV